LITEDFPKFKVAAIQASPVYLDREGTVDKVRSYVEEAKRKGANVVVFGESYIPGFPIWNLIYPPIDQHGMRKKLYENAVEVPGPTFDQIANIANENDVILSVGITEKDRKSPGTMWNTNLLIDKHGRLILKHRKIVPTWAEMLTWARGDGSTLKVVETKFGALGSLICGENTNPLARYSLLAQGEQLHIATYPPAWPFRRHSQQQYDLTEAVRIRTAAHSFEGKVFTVAASVGLDEVTIETLEEGYRGSREVLQEAPKPVSLITDPSGRVIGGPLVGSEGIVIAEVDLERIIEEKEIHDILGYYNRFDIFKFQLNDVPQRPLWRKGEKEAERRRA